MNAVYQNIVLQQEQRLPQQQEQHGLPQQQHGQGFHRATLMKPEFHEVLQQELQKMGHGQPSGRRLPDLNVKPPSNEQQHLFPRNNNGNAK